MTDSAHRSRTMLVLIAAVLVAGVAAAGLVLLRDGNPLGAPPTPSPSTTSPPAPSPTPVPQPERFRVRLLSTKVDTMGNGWIFRRRPGNTKRGAARHADRAIAELNRYLNGAFVNPITRFTDGPVNRLLTGTAEEQLEPRDRRALGVGGPLIDGGQTGPAIATARVLYDGRRAFAVTVSYRARINVALAESSGDLQPVRQRGVLVFVPTKAGWRADMVEVSLELPEPRPAGTPTPPSPTSSPGSPSTTPASTTPPPTQSPS